ncbi:F-BAR and double SH3 domains protein 2-like isoform X2 [Ptychodera flava]|uniref:F-BAR and double SH3 domains protein 2-like isoform X2 n=1 Tax=Ptychodera flava TaxID=63121 RepID=UPI00396A2CB2
MQPPPRKTKISQHVRNVHAEQATKLHAKHQTENDLLEDIRDFAKQRSSIEKTYAQALIKLAQDFYAKRKFPPTPDVKADESKESRSVYDVWKAILEETSKSGKARQATAEKLQTQVVDNAKIVKSQKTQLHKRCSEILNTLHEEVDVTIREFTKAKKSYIENETMAKEIREKAADAENRLKKGSVKIFQSKGTLEKNCAKLASKRDQCNRRSTFARNEYIINMSGANAHQTRYHSVDLPELIATLDGNVFEKFQEYFRALSSAEMATSAFVQNCFNKVLGDADMITREYDLECFLQENPAFTDIPHYNYEPVEGDQMKTVCLSNNLSLHFNKEARKWATRVARENKTIKDLEKTIAGVQTLINTTVKPPESTDNNQPSEVELKLEELKKNLRKSEISKLKAQAKLDSLRTTEIDVDEWLNSANETVAQEDDTISRTESHTSSNSGGSSGYGATADDFNRSDSFQDDSFDETFDEPYDSGSVSPMTPTTDTPQYPIQCVALYDYQAQRDDELTITQNESLEIIEESEGDGWIRGRNSAGDVGYFPESYIEIIRDTESLTAAPQFEPSSYTSNASSITDMEVQAATVGMSGTESGAAVVCMARALYDYDGVSEEELSFSEGQLIKVTRKDENGIDDGFWEGEIDGKIGVFPSLVVEEVEGSNDMQTPDTPTSVVTPPDVCIPSSAQTIPRTKSLNMQYGRPMQSALETPSEKPRPASVNIAEQHYSTHDKLPTPTYEHTRSAPQSPSQSRKPFRTAPPPPSKVSNRTSSAWPW